ncbi:uncharacterized protein LOC125043318 [Penaeus chinensis]|uniref:uncharacterized protein LOC125043318 n=1 Tax=Penaeus chinensis TaxID=139456 RepID=UPI001FB7E078|nr:uncharacterized protein LOC125043318 [Penaeus chinensis]
MNWVGGVRRRILLKEEEQRRQEQFFAVQASSKIRNSGRKTLHKAERENTNAKAVVHIKSRSNYHQWKNEQVIYHRLRQGVPPSHLKHQEQSSEFTPGIPVTGRNRTEKQDLGAAVSDGFTGEKSGSIKINPASIHCPFSKYLLQLEVQGIENKLKEHNKRRTEAKMLDKSIKGQTELNVSIGKEERDKDKRDKELNTGKKRRQQTISIQENVYHSFPCHRKKSENQIFMDDSNHQKYENEKMNEFFLQNGSRKIDQHIYLCSQKDKCLSIKACSKAVGRKNISGIKDWKNIHRKGKLIASSSCANGWRGSKLASTDKRKIMSEVKKKEPNSVPSLQNGAPHLRHMLTLSPACHKGQIWVPLKLLHQYIDTNISGRAFSQDDEEAGKVSHFKTKSNESIQCHENESNCISILSQKHQENHRTSDTNKEEENHMKMLIRKCTKLMPEELSHSAESTIEISKQVQQCNPTFGKQEKGLESFKLHPRLITYITDENNKQFSGKKKNLDHEDFSACTKKNQKRELHYIYKDNTILSAEEPQKTPTPTRGRLRLSDFTRKVYEVESGLSFARNRKDKTPYLDKSIPTPWRSQTCAQTPGGSSGKSSTRTPTDPVFDRSLEYPFETEGDSEACKVSEENISIAKSQDKATCEAAHDIPANSKNVYVTVTTLESGLRHHTRQSVRPKAV